MAVGRTPFTRVRWQGLHFTSTTIASKVLRRCHEEHLPAEVVPESGSFAAATTQRGCVNPHARRAGGPAQLQEPGAEVGSLRTLIVMFTLERRTLSEGFGCCNQDGNLSLVFSNHFVTV